MTGNLVPDGLQIDHHDLNGTNNIWENLRLATNSQNKMNTRKYRCNKSGHKGVFKVGKKWRVVIHANRCAKDLGLFAKLEDAAAAYEKAAYELHGEFVRVS